MARDELMAEFVSAVSLAALGGFGFSGSLWCFVDARTTEERIFWGIGVVCCAAGFLWVIVMDPPASWTP